MLFVPSINNPSRTRTDHLRDVLTEVDTAIYKMAEKKLHSLKYGLQCDVDMFRYEGLVGQRAILEAALLCDDCLQVSTEELIYQTKIFLHQ